MAQRLLSPLTPVAPLGLRPRSAPAWHTHDTPLPRPLPLAPPATQHPDLIEKRRKVYADAVRPYAALSPSPTRIPSPMPSLDPPAVQHYTNGAHS